MIAAIIKLLTGGLLDKVLDLGRTYITSQTDRAEFEKQVKIAAEETAGKVQEAWAEATAKVTASTQDTLKASPILQRAFAIVLFMQLFVLVWHQIGAACFQIITGIPWPAPMASIEWAYLLIGAMVAPILILKR